MGIIVGEDQDLFDCYRRGAYRKLLSVVRKKQSYEIKDLLLVGLAYYNLREYEKSRKCVNFVIERAEEASLWGKHARFIHSQLSLANKDWENAITVLEELHCMEYPYEVPLTNSLAYAYWQNENVPQAIFSLERVLEYDGNNASALNSLGFILADTDDDLLKAYSLCEKANQIRADYSPYLDSLGWALYKLGQRAKAIYALRKAMILTPDSKEVSEHLKSATIVAY